MRLNLHARKQPRPLLAAKVLPLLAAVAIYPTARLAAADAGGPPGGAEVRKVDVGGYKLTLSTRGSGGPTVVIEPGFGHATIEGDEWNAVRDEVAKTNLVVSYDRLGLGSSDPFPDDKPRTSKDAARDLHNLLKAAKVPGPYVIVAQSIGGLNARVYANTYPDEVAGIVLVDSTHPDQDAKWLAALPKQKANEDPAVTRARQFLQTRQKDHGANPEHLDTAPTFAQARAVKSFGDKPLAVVTHSPTWKFIPDLPDELLKPLEDVNQRLQAESVKMSTNSSQRIAKTAGHHIHVEDPQLVIDAILEVVGKVKPKGS